MNKEKLFEKMYLIRKVEEYVEDLFTKGLLRGTTHGYRGQEAIAVGVLEHIDCESDYITGNHRSHGHYLALNPDPYPFFAELMGKVTGLVQGKGASQHIAYKNFYTNGITGGMVPVATGLAFQLKKFTKDRICVSFFGDGAINEGYVMEALNLASVLELPILFILENNRYAMSTDFYYSNKGRTENRIKGFGIDYLYHKALDVIDIYNFSNEIISDIRIKRKPAFIEFETHRFSGHSKSDKREYIPNSLDEYWINNDPLVKLKNELSGNTIEFIENSVHSLILKSIEKAKSDSYDKE